MSRGKRPANKRFGAPSARSRSLFLKTLKKDLAAAGFRIRKPRARNVGWRVTPPDHRAQAIRLHALRTKQISESSDFIRRMETDGALTLLGDGRLIDPTRICPKIKICVSSADHEV